MKTIVLIEDHGPLRKNLGDMLDFEGYRVVECATATAGLHAVREARPDLVLCDIMLPDGDGREILATLRADQATRAVPFIFLTAKGEPQDVRSGMNLGADDYLPKPVARVDLLTSIAARLERVGQLRARPDFSSPAPLAALGVSPREAEVLLWMAQGKSNGEIAIIVSCSPATVKKHVMRILEKLGVESRGAAMLVALEQLAAG